MSKRESSDSSTGGDAARASPLVDQASTDLRIAVLDAFTLLQQLNANAANFGLTNTTAACLTPDTAPFFCQQPDEYLFWDGIHPTRHAIVADEAARILTQQ